MSVNIDIEEEDRCIICLDKKNKIERVMCFKNIDKLEKINCSCNGYCHRSCIIEYIQNNDNKQNCFICKSKEYSPKYIKKSDSLIIFILKTIKKILIDIYNILVIAFLFILLYFLSSYFWQILKLITNHQFFYNPLDAEFVGEGLIATTVIYLIISGCVSSPSL